MRDLILTEVVQGFGSEKDFKLCALPQTCSG